MSEPSKQYFILINTDFFPRGPGWLGAVISRHYRIETSIKAQERVHREALTPITTAIYQNHFMPVLEEYLATGYGGPEIRHPVHVRTILKSENQEGK